ncbi:hypothetical protein ACWEGQ_21520 [Streptomyces seoulensis]
MLPTSPPTGSFPAPMSFETAWEMTEVPMMLGVANSRGPASWSHRKATELKGVRNIEGDPTGLNLVTGPEELQTDDALLQRMPRPSHGRVLSLDAVLGDGISPYDLIAAEADLLPRIAHGVFEDERLNAVLRGLDQVERDIAFAYGEGEGTTWAEAAAFVGAPNPEAIGERVRRKTKRLAAEQRRRLAQRDFYRVVHSSRRMSPEVTRIDASA